MITYSLQPEPFEYQEKKSDFKIQTLFNFLSSLLRAQRRTPLPSMITTDIGMSG